MGDSVKLKVVVLIFYTGLVDIHINELAEPYFVQVQRNVFLSSLSVLMLGFLDTVDEFTCNFVTLLKGLRRQTRDHFLN